MIGLDQHAEPAFRGIRRSQTLVLPDDEHNRTLLENVHPLDWTNPTPSERYNLVVVGAGTAGLVSAAGAAGLGAKVALVEKHLLGGDCLNYGCVPSKALLRSARALAGARGAEGLGLRLGGPAAIDFPRVMGRMRELRAGLSRHDSVARFSSLGIDVFLGEAYFVAPDAIEVDGRTLRFSKAVIASGARAAVPAMPGLEAVGFVTNETIFSLAELPRRLIVVGGGPIGVELGQAFRRFGSEVAMVTRGPRILPHEDTDISAQLCQQLRQEGIWIEANAEVVRAEWHKGDKSVIIKRDGKEERISGDCILVAVGRRANVEGLGLEAAGVDYSERGVIVDDRLRTSNRRVFAAGDICSEYKFTHAADAMARIALQNALFFGRKRMSKLVIPHCTYTEPEVAQVGIRDAEARLNPRVGTYTVPLADVDRAVLDGQTNGFARVHIDRRSGRILGATMVATHAGDLIGEMALAMTAGLSIKALAGTIHPYPTQAEAWKKLGDAWNRSRLSPAWKRVLGRLFTLLR